MKKITFLICLVAMFVFLGGGNQEVFANEVKNEVENEVIQASSEGYLHLENYYHTYSDGNTISGTISFTFDYSDGNWSTIQHIDSVNLKINNTNILSNVVCDIPSYNTSIAQITVTYNNKSYYVLIAVDEYSEVIVWGSDYNYI